MIVEKSRKKERVGRSVRRCFRIVQLLLKKKKKKKKRFISEIHIFQLDRHEEALRTRARFIYLHLEKI